MEPIRPPYVYELKNFESKDQVGQIIQFIEKEPVSEGSDDLLTIYDGTTTEEILEVAIHRLQTLQNGMFPCWENACAIGHLQGALVSLHERTRKRQLRNVADKHTE